MVLQVVVWCCTMLIVPHGGAWCYTMPGPFPAPPIFSGKSPGDEVVRARVYLLVCTCVFDIMAFYPV